jgi:TPP-dependent pyruvate/acetoin dehydrogenase alpha subunit
MDLGLGELADGSKFHDSLDISGLKPELLKDQLRKMILIRKAEEKIADKITEGKIVCPCHLGIGQEAVGVAVAAVSRKSDRAFGAHRSHTHFLGLNEDVETLFAEVLGKNSGCSHGMGGSMHIIDKSVGFYGSVPIVGATIPIATGAGLAAKLDGKGDIAVSYFGDGACEEGVFHESLNMAASMNLPVLYVCENNLFSSHLHISLRQPSNSTARFAKAHCIDYAVVDGNDVASMTKTLEAAVQRMRETNKPFFLEAVTYRWRGHVGPREDIDVGVKRDHDLVLWKKRDPIGRLLSSMVDADIVDDEYYKALNLKIGHQIESAWDKAEKAEYPPVSLLLDCVYDK